MEVDAVSVEQGTARWWMGKRGSRSALSQHNRTGDHTGLVPQPLFEERVQQARATFHQHRSDTTLVKDVK
jgi:hypothetical protein